MLLFLAMLVVAAGLIDPGYLAQTLNRPAAPGLYLKLVWLGSSIGIVAGALGSSLESEEAVRNATYGARPIGGYWHAMTWVDLRPRSNSARRR